MDGSTKPAPPLESPAVPAPAPSVPARRPRPAARDLALWAAAASACFVALRLVAWYWPGGLPYDATSGVWVALADDWAHGTLYRPVHGAEGYGGTRYMPLFFLLQGWLMRGGIGAISGGLALTAASLAIFLAGLYAVLRALGVVRLRAAGTTLLLPGFISVQLLTLATHGDLLAAGLLLWGLRAALAHRTLPAAACWTLAFAAKLTALWAPLVVAGWWLLQATSGHEGRPGGPARGSFRATSGAPALRLLALTLLGATAVVLLAVWASDGRMLASFAAASDGGATLRFALLAPWWLLYSGRQDPFFLALAAVALVLAGRRVRRQGWDLLTAWAAGATLSTLVIFASPGADTNHFLDMTAAALVLLALEAPAREATLIAAVFAVAQLGSQLPDAPSVRNFLAAHGRPTTAAAEGMRARLAARGETRPVLSQTPLLPVLWGQRPVVADAFALRLLAERDPAIAGELRDALRARRYAAVVLVDWTGRLPRALAHPRAGDPALRGGLDFPVDFIADVGRHYRPTLWQPPLLLLEPRP